MHLPRIALTALLVGVLTACLGLLLSDIGARARADSQQSPPSQGSDAAAAAARKKKFEEAKQQLDNSQSSSAAKIPESKSELEISPAQVGMLVHEQQGFTAFDLEGHNLTAKAEWTLSNSYVVELAQSPMPTIIAKNQGTVTVRARVGSLRGEATVKVYPGDKLPDGTVRWAAPSRPGYRVGQIV